jgi:hypothetical protein
LEVSLQSVVEAVVLEDQPILVKVEVQAVVDRNHLRPVVVKVYLDKGTLVELEGAQYLHT